ncbi:PAS domain-containing sensor histidine kinase [Methanolacinia petrolearia]|nr:PAS domain-containing sensor histidine kinase [Methanolacinia petrolearia]
MQPFLEIIGEESGKKDVSYLAMIGLVIFMVVLSETALVFTTSGFFLLLSNLFYFPLIFINMKCYERGLTVNSSLGAVYFIISLFLVHFDVVDILIAFSMTVTYVAVGISIAMISKTNNENKNILIGSISNYENFFEEIQDAILVYNSSGDILGVNNAASRLFGLEKKYLTFLKIEDLGNFIEKDDLKKAFYDISPSKSGFTDTRLKQQDGNTIYVEILSSVVDPSKGIMRAYIRDVTSRVVAEEKIHDSEARYRHLTNQLPEMIFELDIDGNFTFSTRYSINLAGKTPEELTDGMKFWDILVEDDRDRARKNLEWFYKGMFLGAVEYRLAKPDGAVIPVMVHFSYDFDDNSAVQGIRGLAMDISQRKRMEMALRRNEKKFRSLFENSNDAVIIFDRDGYIIDINTRLCLMLGIRRDEAVSQTLESRFPVPEWGKISQMYENSSSEGVCFESRMQNKEGSFIDVEISSGIIDPGEGLYQAILRDISERKRAEAELALSRGRLNLAIEGAGMCVWDWDLEKDEMVFEGKYEEMFGLLDGNENSHGAIWREILQEEFYTKIMDLYSTCNDPERSDPKTAQFESEYKFRTSAGTYKWITVLGKVVKCSSDGNPVRITGIMQDVSDKRRSQNALSEANKKLNLLSSITRHDILNQIAGVRGFTDILSKRLPEKNSELLHYLDMIKRATSNIQEQITFTKDYQNIGVESPAWQNLEKVIESSRSKAQLRDVAFFNECHGLEIYADPMIEKIFFNLLDNAIRHGGSVTEIDVKCRKSRNFLFIVVRDNGTGVPGELKEKIFDHGYGSNTGLGLFLVREILGITGMEIKEVGEPGNGAVFEIKIPADHYRQIG